MLYLKLHFIENSAGQKEQLALISTVGFAAAIGSRLFIGLFMDRQGPKTTSVLCCLICFAGFLLLAICDESQLSGVFLPAWVLLSLGGSGLHITGFHFTNLFQVSCNFLVSIIVHQYLQHFWWYNTLSSSLCQLRRHEISINREMIKNVPQPVSQLHLELHLQFFHWCKYSISTLKSNLARWLFSTPV